MTQPQRIETPTTPRPRPPAGPGTHRVADIHVLRLRGTAREMGRQHGALLREVIPHGPLPYYRTYVRKLLGQAGVGALSPVVWSGLQLLVGRRVAKKIPPFAMETLTGLAEGAGLPIDDVLEGATMPDGLLWLMSRLIGKVDPGPAVRHRLALSLGCTSAIAWGAATTDGKLLHARNLDYHGVDCWPRTKAVLFHAPEDGMRYASVAAAGVPLGGVTAMNEAGLTLTVHQHMFTAETRLGGTPIGIVGDIVMRKARSLDDAEAILAEHRPIGCWTYLVCDGRRRELLCWEENPDHRTARRIGPEATTFGYANIYLDPVLGATEQDLYPSYWRHNQARHRRANERLAGRTAPLDPAAMAGVLGDTGDPRCRISEATAMLMTVGSVVFRPEDGVFWVATGEAPTSRNSFVPFDLAREDHAPEHGTLPAAEPDEAYEAYRRAYLNAVDGDDAVAARAELERARALRPDEPLYHHLAGLVALRAGDAQAAADAVDRAIALGHPHPERVAAFHLWRGRAHDLAGRRDRAVADYRAALARPADRAVFAAARRGLRRRFTAARAAKFTVDYTYADVAIP